MAQVNFDALADADPIQAQKVQFRIQQLERQGGMLDQHMAQARARQEQAEREHAAAITARGMDVLRKSIPDFGPERGQQLMQYAQKAGVSDYALERANYDPAMVVLIDKARRWDELQDGKPRVMKRASQVPPVVKPGGARQTQARAQADKVSQVHRKVGSVESAAAALLARSNTRKR